MANVLTTGAWLSAPTKKPSFFVRLLRVQIDARQRKADRVVEQYLATHGLDKLTDDAERQIERLLFRGVSSHGHNFLRAPGNQACSLWERGS